MPSLRADVHHFRTFLPVALFRFVHPDAKASSEEMIRLYDLVLAQPFSATFWWISSLVSLPTLGKELEGAKRSTATSLGGRCNSKTLRRKQNDFRGYQSGVKY